MELMANKFQVIVTSMKKKPYDYLDQRKTEFDTDFEEFKRQINELHVSLIKFETYTVFIQSLTFYISFCSNLDHEQNFPYIGEY